LIQLAAVRRARLEESLKLQSFYRDADEEEIWVTEKDYFVQSTDYGHDLNTAMILLAKHDVNMANLICKYLYMVGRLQGENTQE
jgi:hypothetical protein